MKKPKKPRKTKACYFCPTKTTHKDYCYGCKENVCDDCAGEAMGDHEVKDHPGAKKPKRIVLGEGEPFQMLNMDKKRIWICLRHAYPEWEEQIVGLAKVKAKKIRLVAEVLE